MLRRKLVTKCEKSTKTFNSRKKMFSFGYDESCGPYISLRKSRKTTELAGGNIAGNTLFSALSEENVSIRYDASPRESRSSQNRLPGRHPYRQQATTSTRNFRRKTLWF